MRNAITVIVWDPLQNVNVEHWKDPEQIMQTQHTHTYPVTHPHPSICRAKGNARRTRGPGPCTWWPIDFRFQNDKWKTDNQPVPALRLDVGISKADNQPIRVSRLAAWKRRSENQPVSQCRFPTRRTTPSAVSRFADGERKTDNDRSSDLRLVGGK